MFLLIGKWKKSFLGENLAIFSHFVAHDGSEIAPISEIWVPKILSVYFDYWDVKESKLYAKMKVNQ